LTVKSDEEHFNLVEQPFNDEKCLGQHYAGSGTAKEAKHCQRRLIGSLQTNSGGGQKITKEEFL
jgi:hypothetical protein